MENENNISEPVDSGGEETEKTLEENQTSPDFSSAETEQVESEKQEEIPNVAEGGIAEETSEEAPSETQKEDALDDSGSSESEELSEENVSENNIEERPVVENALEPDISENEEKPEEISEQASEQTSIPEENSKGESEQKPEEAPATEPKKLGKFVVILIAVAAVIILALAAYLLIPSGEEKVEEKTNEQNVEKQEEVVNKPIDVFMAAIDNCDSAELTISEKYTSYHTKDSKIVGKWYVADWDNKLSISGKKGDQCIFSFQIDKVNGIEYDDYFYEENKEASEEEIQKMKDDYNKEVQEFVEATTTCEIDSSILKSVIEEQQGSGATIYSITEQLINNKTKGISCKTK